MTLQHGYAKVYIEFKDKFKAMDFANKVDTYKENYTNEETSVKRNERYVTLTKRYQRETFYNEKEDIFKRMMSEEDIRKDIEEDLEKYGLSKEKTDNKDFIKNISSDIYVENESVLLDKLPTITGLDRIKTLASFLGVEERRIKADKGVQGLFIVDNRDKFYVLDDNEAWRLTKKHIKDDLYNIEPSYIYHYSSAMQKAGGKSLDVVYNMQETLKEDANPLIEALIDDMYTFINDLMEYHKRGAYITGKFEEIYDKEFESNGLYIYPDSVGWVVYPGISFTENKEDPDTDYDYE